jgi:hypothetical protein
VAELYLRKGGLNLPEKVSADNPLPVSIYGDLMPAVAGRTVTRVMQVPGVGTGAAYEAGDAFGTLMTFQDVFRPEKCSGVIVSAFLIDLDDEGLQKDVVVFEKNVTGVADNAAFAPTDLDMLSCRGAFSITSFVNLGSNQIGTANNINLWMTSSDQHLRVWLVTQGADNIAAGSVPWIGLVVVPD